MATTQNAVVRAENNTWRRLGTDASTAVIFVHGFFSNAEKCWRHADGTFWPDLLAADTRLPDVSVFLAGYYTAIDSGSYGVQDCAREVMAALERTGKDGTPAPITYTKIIFVCHSLGGIVTRQLLDANRDAFKGKTVGLCLFASPSIGSDYADALGFVASIFNNRTATQLQTFGVFLEDLDDRFARLLDKNNDFKILGAEAIEHKSAFLAWLPWFRPIVEKKSAARYFGMRQTLPDTNHGSIVKPQSLDSPGHQFLVDYFSLNTVFADSKSLSDLSNVSSHKPTDALFDVYEARFEPYYIVRDLDNHISDNCALRSVWIAGPPGVGKTCALKRFTSMQSGANLHICMSQCPINANRQNMIDEMAEALTQFVNGPRERTYAAIIGSLDSIASNRIVLYIDEVPSGEGEQQASQALLLLLSEILTTWKQRSDSKQLTFVVSSLSKPSTSNHPRPEKLIEQFAFIETAEWDVTSLVKLNDVVTKSLPKISLDSSSSEAIVRASKGSPRFLKNVLRTLYFSDNQISPEVAVAQVAEQLRA